MKATPVPAPARLLAAAAACGIDIHQGLQLWEAGALRAAARPPGLPGPGDDPAVRSYAETQGLGAYTPPAVPFPLAPAVPALIWWRSGGSDQDNQQLAALATLLSIRYPPDHPVALSALDAAGALVGQQASSLAELPSRDLVPFAFCLLHVPGLAIDSRGADGLAWVVARLLGPGGCPWDVRQTHQSLRGALLEEAYEVLEALDTGDMAALGEELGDLLIAVFAHGEMARQAGYFDLGDVFAQISAKLIGRHPHVFSNLSVDGEGQVLRNWEQIKAAELAAKGRARTSALDGVPPALPALAAAQKLGKKAARAGFNWAELPQVWAKLREELDELAVAEDSAQAAEELGDLLFVLTRLADWLHLDAETVLREANLKFRRRFARLEAAAQGRPLQSMALDELLTLWDATKDGPEAPDL